MKLIQALQEASSITPQDLKKEMKKSAVLKCLFDKDSKFDDIKDVAEFVSTVKFLFLNNREVLEFVKSRDDIKNISATEFANLRKIRASDFEESHFARVKDLVSAFFKEFNEVDSKKLSKDARAEIENFINSNHGYHDIKKWVQTELFSIPDIRPKAKVLVYRGLLFKEYDMQRTEKYDGTMHDGQGIKFLKSVRANNKTVDLSWDRASSWTTDKSVAERFAKYGPAQSNFSATLQWLGRMKDEKAIDGRIGFVIATLADPEDIIVDVDLLNSHSTLKTAHGSESEVILKAGTYLCKITSRFTSKGEVDQVDDNSFEAVAAAYQQIEQLDIPKSVYTYTDERWVSRAVDLLRNRAGFRKLASDEVTRAALAANGTAIRLARKLIKSVGDIDSIIAKDDDQIKQLNIVRAFIMRFKTDAEANEVRKKINDHQLTAFSKQYSQNMKATDRTGSQFLRDIGLAVKAPIDKKNIHLFSAVNQKPYIDNITDAFFDYIGLDAPTDKKEAVSTMINLLLRAYRNYHVFQSLKPGVI